MRYYLGLKDLRSTGPWAYLVQRAPALCGVWGRVSVASLTLACCNTRRPRLEPGTFRSQAVRLYRLHQACPSNRVQRTKKINSYK